MGRLGVLSFSWLRVRKKSTNWVRPVFSWPVMGGLGRGVCGGVVCGVGVGGVDLT